MRKTSVVLIGAAAGAAITLWVSQPHMIFGATSAQAAMADAYRPLNLFGTAFEHLRSDYVGVPDDSKLRSINSRHPAAE